MNLHDDILNEWRSDAVMGDDLFDEARRIPILHAKWLDKYLKIQLIKKEKVLFEDIKLEDLKVVKSIALSNSIVGVVEIHEIYDYNGIKWKSKTSKPLKFLN